jgi:hypothetical protein
MQRLEFSGAVRHTHTHIYIYIYIHIYICMLLGSKGLNKFFVLVINVKLACCLGISVSEHENNSFVKRVLSAG